MENHEKLLFFSLFSLITFFNSVNSICVPINSTNSCTSPSPIPHNSQHVPSATPSPPAKSTLPIFPIKKLCDSTDYPDICISSITPFLNDKTDPLSVAGMAITAASEYTKLAISIASKIALSPEMASVVNDCKDSYNDALDNFKEAMVALADRDVGTMNSMLSAAITDFSDCDDWLSGIKSPLLDFDTKLIKMTSNCLAIVSLIK